jgi:two-component sensor histidine kinase/putative methionine-R-sulfoxide reductase with GAF domain
MSNDLSNNANRTSENFSYSVLEVIHGFSKLLRSVSSESDVFSAIVSELAPRLNLEDCVVYKVDGDLLIQVAAHGEKILDGEIQNRLTLRMGEGHAGMAALKKETLVYDDVSISEHYIPDVVIPGSEIEVPIIINDKCVAVVSSEHRQKGFFNEHFVKAFEIVATIAEGALVKIFENSELSKIKNQLEVLVAQKSSDISRMLSTLSEQYTELKHQHEKREILMQEIHHRVNNNLQIISSMLRLHMSVNQDHDHKVLKSIHNRVQAMALIHQNIYKSVELNTVDVEAYLRDLFNHIRLTFGHLFHFRFNTQSSVSAISLNTLVPCGLLIVELYDEITHSYSEAGVSEAEFHVTLTRKDATYILTIQDSLDVKLNSCWNFTGEEEVSGILRNALLDQIQGEILLTCNEGENTLKISFSD